MKQKRKVKSLISSNGENKNLLTTLLFLVGGILFFGALALFASIGGVASAENDDEISYPGIEDRKEVLLRFGLIPEGGTDAVSEMYLTGKTFFVKGDAGLSVDGAGMSLGDGKYINFLGGETDGVNIDSDNVTIIGGRVIKILDNNDNTTVLGGSENTVNPGSNSVAPVMLGGQNNTIGSDQEGSAIIGGRNNKIGDNSSYNFIVGGENNEIDANSENAVVGGARVKVRNEKSNLFAFSAEGDPFEPQGGNAFYLNVKQGLGLNKAASDLSENNLGVDSNGAVSFGEINIRSASNKCTSSDLGVQGSFEGCLIGCTELGAANGKWEMIDHGDKCERLCNLPENAAYCMVSPIEPEEPDPYYSYCTTNGVDTGHSHHCGGENLILPHYQNVLFETTLIDSEDPCPQPGTTGWTENRCVFKCDGEYHLTGDQTGMGGRTKCYKDCKLPWDGTKIKHNETRIAYNTDETYCAFPSGSPSSPHTCANHKKTIICQNGTLYLQKSNGEADTAHPAITDGYVYSGCMLNQYRCNTAIYNYSASDITSSSKFNDTVTTWNLTDRGTTNGTRGKYKLCIDYNTNPNIVQQLNGERCDALNKTTSPNRYTTHYQWVGCQANYHTGVGYENVCMKDCTLKKTNGQTQYYRHNTTLTGYKAKEKTCTAKCEGATIVCNDGKWRLGSLNGTQTTAYVYNNCTLKDYNCASKYNVTEAEKQAHESTSIYGNHCVPYKANNTDKVTCTAQSTKYELTDCIPDYHTENNKRCIRNHKDVNCNTSSVWKPANSHFNVVPVTIDWTCGWKGTASSCWTSPTDCGWLCDTNYHKEGSDLCCHDGEHSDGGSCASNDGSAQCIQAGGVDNSHYIIENVPIIYNTSDGTWSTPRNCRWECDEGFVENGGKCDEVPDSVVGKCGTEDYYSCDAGTVTGKTISPDETEYRWVCEGINGGSNSPTCTAPRSKDGWCKGTHWGCYVGDDEEHNETADEYTWVCRGINDGEDDYCSEAKDNTVKVKFKIVNNLDRVIYLHEVEEGDPKDSCGLSVGGETDYVLNGNGTRVVSDYSTYTFVAGQSYYVELVYGDGGDCEANNNLCTRAYATFTAVVGENLVTFNVSDSSGLTPGSCGSANLQVLDSKPISNLCDAGVESPVSTTSTGWTWTCGQGANRAYCMAWAKPVCGPATSTPSLNPNSTDLCSVGEASALVEDAWEGMSQYPIWKWTCRASTTVENCWTYIPTATVNAANCGNSWSVQFTTDPYSNSLFNGISANISVQYKCNELYNGNYESDPAVIHEDTIWVNDLSWANASMGGIWQTPNNYFGICGYDMNYTILSASINSINPTEKGGYRLIPGAACGSTPSPQCGSANNGTYTEAPSSNLCSVGIAGPVQENESTGIYYWLCSVGTDTTTCQATKQAVKVNGKCGTEEAYACDAGTATGKVVLDTEYQWVCAGSNGGTDSPTCKYLISKDGVCNTTHYNCIRGEAGSKEGQNGSTEWTWTCGGVNGGNPVNCSESCPTGQTIQNDECKSSAITSTLHLACNVTKVNYYNNNVPDSCRGPGWLRTEYTLLNEDGQEVDAPADIEIFDRGRYNWIRNWDIGGQCLYYQGDSSIIASYIINEGESRSEIVDSYVDDRYSWEVGQGFSYYYGYENYYIGEADLGEGYNLVMDPCTETTEYVYESNGICDLHMHFFYGGSVGDEGTDYGAKFVGFKIGGLYQTVNPATYHWDYGGQSTMDATIKNLPSSSGVGFLIYQYEEEDEYGNWNAVGDEITRRVSWGANCNVENDGHIDFY